VTQPWHFYLLGERARAATVDLVRVITTSRSDAANGKRKAERWKTIPGLMVVTCEASADPLLQLEDYAACCCAVQNMALYLWQSGVGMKWTSGPIIRDPRYYEALGIDASRRTIVGLMFYGYPKTVPQQRRLGGSQILTRLD
jgi:nitroreductase